MSTAQRTTTDDRNQVYRNSSVVFLLAAATLTESQTVVEATANTATDSYAITLPCVATAANMMLSVWANIANTKAITLQDQNDSLDWTDLTLDTDNDHVVLWSDGRRWHTMLNGIA